MTNIIHFPTQALAQILAGPFPATKTEILDRVGEGEIKLGDGQQLRVKAVIEESPIEKFDSLAEVAEEIGTLLSQHGRRGDELLTPDGETPSRRSA